MILFFVSATRSQICAENSSPQTEILSEVIELFYDNEARGLLHYYEKHSEPEILPEIFAEASGFISTQITDKNRSKMLLHVMRVLNMFHEHKKNIRFSILQGLSIEQIYYMIWRWRNAIYTSSYNASLDRIMELLNETGTEKDFFEILKNRNFEGLGTFLEAASSYNRLGDLIVFFTPAQQIEIADFLLNLICLDKSLDYTITLTELLLLSRNEKLLRYANRKIMDATKKQSLPCLSSSNDNGENRESPLSENKADKDDIPENKADKDGIPENEADKDSIPENESNKDGIPENESNKDGIPENEADKDGIPENEADKDGIPENEADKDGIPENKADKDGIPENEADKDGIPENKADKDGIPENSSDPEELIRPTENTDKPEIIVKSLESSQETTSEDAEPKNDNKNQSEINNENDNSPEKLETDETALHFFKLIVGAYSHFFPHFVDTESIRVDIDRSNESEEIPAWLLSQDEIQRFEKLTESTAAMQNTTITTDSQKEKQIETQTAELMEAKQELRLFADSFILKDNKYRMPTTNVLNSAHLFNEQKIHLQRHYFFGDTDGIVTFMVFQRIFANDPDWSLEDHPTYIKIYRKNPITGLQVIMLANKPRLRLKAEAPIQEELNKYGGGFHAFIFRGHSYNMHRVINDITPMTKIAFLGSCGGFENLDTILHLSKEAHIVYSKGTGTIWVNNTFLRELGNRLIVEPDINWPELKIITRESVARELARRDIKDRILAIFDKFYIFPHENTGAIMIRKNMQMENDFPEIFGYSNEIEEPPGWLIIRPD
jgi:hypothetical protein